MAGPEDTRPEPKKASGSRYSLWVGLAFLVLIGIATINTLRSNEGGLLGAEEADAGEPLPEFAVPELLRGEDKDANIFQDDCETSANPCPPDERRTPACEVDLPNVINVCDLLDRPLVLSFWFSNPRGMRETRIPRSTRRCCSRWSSSGRASSCTTSFTSASSG